MPTTRVICLSATILAVSVTLPAQEPSGPLWESYARGIAVLREALEAHGGADAIRGLTSASFRWEGEDYAPTQGRIPDWTNTAGNARRTVQDVQIDYARNRFLFDREFFFGGGYLNAVRVAGEGVEMVVYNPQAERGMGGMTFQRDSSGTPARRNLAAAGAGMPILLLRGAIARAATVRYLGEARHQERAEHVIGFVTADGDAVTLHVDAATHLVSARAEIGAGSLGDEVDIFRFGDYRQVDGFHVPHRMDVMWNGMLTGRHELVRFSRTSDLGESVLGVPPGYTAPAPAAPPAAVQVSEGVYFLERLGGSYRMLVVDTDEGLVAVDAPLSAPVTESAIGLIEKTFPGRPLRYLVVTHHHGDHIGGIPAFAARGVTILVPPGTAKYLEQMTSVRRTFGQVGAAQSTASKPPADLSFAPVSARRRIGTGDQAVEILDISPTSHAAGMLAVYVPSARLLFQGDLLRVNEHGGPVAAADAARDLARVIERHALDVDLIGAVHGLNGTLSDLQEAMRKGEAGAAR